MQNVKETNLAWALVEAARPHLSATERSRVFVTVGAGDTFTAIRILLKLLSTKRIPLRTDLVRQCTAWLGTYACHQEEQHLRRLIENYLAPDAPTASSTVGSEPAPTTPKRPDSLAINKLVSHTMAAC